MAKTMFDKIWDAHELGDGLIYIDLHLVHEVTSPRPSTACDWPAARSAGRTRRSRPPITTFRPTAPRPRS